MVMAVAFTVQHVYNWPIRLQPNQRVSPQALCYQQHTVQGTEKQPACNLLTYCSINRRAHSERHNHYDMRSHRI